MDPKASSSLSSPKASEPREKHAIAYLDSGFIISADENPNTELKPDGSSNHSKRRFFSDLRNVYHSYEQNKVLGPNLFAPRVSEEIRNAVMNSTSVIEAIDHFLANNPSQTRHQVKSQVMKILNQMNAEPREQITRSMTYCVQKILKRLYRHLTVLDSQIERLRSCAKKAANEKVPLIIMPSHKSHIDYMVIGWLCFQLGISMPFVAAGENLDMPIVGSLLQGSGAFFIRRQFGTDPLYRAIFNEYITQVLLRGYNLQAFIEGGRSRTGKLLNPKMGLLSVVTDALFSGRLKDAYIVPVSIGYDKVIETEGYIQEMLGRSKPPESLVQLLRAIELLKLNFGSIDIRFDEPFSLKKFVDSEAIGRGLNYYEGPKEAIEKARKQVVNVLGYKTMYQINLVSAALPTAMVVTILLTNEGRGVSKTTLVSRVAWLREEIVKRGGVVFNLQGNLASVVDQVALLLGSSIGRHTQLLETVYTPLKRFEMSYYRNSLIHFFVSESIIALGIYSFRINDKRHIENIPKSELMAAAQYLSRLLKYEFIYKPLPDFADNFESTLRWMADEKIVTYDSESQTVSLNEDNLQMFKFLCFLLWPFVECYWMVAAALHGLFPNIMIEEGEFIKGVQKFGETLYYEGELNFFESVSKETTKLALTRFYDRKVLVKRTVSEKGSCIVHLGEKYAENQAKLERFAIKIAQFRRKGKYRTATGNIDTKAISKLISFAPKLKSRL